MNNYYNVNQENFNAKSISETCEQLESEELNKEPSKLISKHFIASQENSCLMNEARALIHNCYVNKLKWNIIYPNPSGIKITRTTQGSIIQDDYDNKAKWFVLIDKNKIVSCARLCHPDNNGLLEVERYDNARESLMGILKNKSHCNLIELNREAVDPSFFHNEAYYFLLLKTIFQYCVIKNYTLLTTSNINEWLLMYDRLGFPNLSGSAFKYFDEDPKHVEVYMADPNQMKKWHAILKNYIKARKTKGSSNFMINLNAFEVANRKYSPQEMPFLHASKKMAKEKGNYKGLKILQNIPLTIEAVLKIVPLILGGADVTVSCIKSLEPCEEAIDILREAGVKIQIEHNFSESYDVLLDCCGELINLRPRIGTVEITQTGSELYKHADLSFPVISIDDSKLKCLETIFGTGDGFVRGLIASSQEEIYNKKFIVFGFGKVGRGIVRALIKHTDRITVIEPNKDKRASAERKGIIVLDGKNIEVIQREIKEAFCIVTATGIKNVISDVYNFNKEFCGTACLANMGAEDEFGGNFTENDVLFSKKPLNFSIPEPTIIKYLDPILYAHNSAIDILQSNKIHPGYHAFPERLSDDILKKWCVFHNENIFESEVF